MLTVSTVSTFTLFELMWALSLAKKGLSPPKSHEVNQLVQTKTVL